MSENTQVATQNTGAAAQKPKTFDMALMEKLDSVNDALPKDFNKQRFVQAGSRWEEPQKIRSSLC